MIIRIFKVTIFPEFRASFEKDFNTISVEMVENHPGFISCEIGHPTKWNPNEYTMITKWENEEALESFAGKNWNVSVIPEKMMKYVNRHGVDHFYSYKPHVP